MFAFVDETGNTGENIFDKNQPYFITAALTTRINFDFAFTRSVKAISSEHGADQIHANQLDYSSLDLIGPKVHRILKASDARVLIAIVEKKYLLACKMVDTIFDSGENIAVPWHVYNIRQLRLLLVFKLYHIVNEESIRDFWSCLMDRNVERAREQFQTVCDRILLNVDRLPDTRSISIISQALNWAKSHPEAIYFHPSGKLARLSHMPNVVGFINLIDSMETQSQLWNRKVKLIKHDRQSQFEKSLEFWHERFKNASADPLYLPGGERHVLRKVMNSKFQISSASESAGIQISDLILWSFKRRLDDREVPDGLIYILRYLRTRSRVNDFSFSNVSATLEGELSRIFDADMTSEQLARGKELIERFEQHKNENLRNFLD